MIEGLINCTNLFFVTFKTVCIFLFWLSGYPVPEDNMLNMIKFTYCFCEHFPTKTQTDFIALSETTISDDNCDIPYNKYYEYEQNKYNNLICMSIIKWKVITIQLEWFKQNEEHINKHNVIIPSPLLRYSTPVLITSECTAQWFSALNNNAI